MEQFKQTIPRTARDALSTHMMHCKLRNENAGWDFVQRCMKLRDLEGELDREVDSEDGTKKKRKEVVINLGQDYRTTEYRRSPPKRTKSSSRNSGKWIL